MRKRIDHWCSVVPEKSQPSGPPFTGKFGKPRFPLERWALKLGFFCPHWTPMMDSIYPAYLYQPMGKIKNARWPHVDLWRHCHVKMESPCNISVYSGLSGSLFHVFRVFQYKMRYLVFSKKQNSLFVWGCDRKICPSRSQFVIFRQASWCQSVILETDFSIPVSH